MLNYDTITKLINTERMYFEYEGEKISAKDINNGYCSEFAQRVIELLGGSSDDVFCMDNANKNYDACISVKEMMDKCPNSYPPFNLSVARLGEISFPYHVWISYKGKYFDSDCPNGVTNVFELPIFLYLIKEVVE